MSMSGSPHPPPSAPQGLRVFRKIAALCAERRFALCISLWEYHVPLYIEAARAPMGLIQVATRPAHPRTCLLRLRQGAQITLPGRYRAA